MTYINDYSFLFEDSSSQMTNNYSWLSEYSNIQSGTYKKVLKAYYAKMESENKTDTDKDTGKKETQTVSETEKLLDQIQVDAKSLSASADALVTKGTDSLFRQKDITVKGEDGTTTTTRGYDADAIYNGVKKFVDGYNSLLTSASESDSSTILNQSLQMISKTGSYASQLSAVGITVNKDDTLSIDEKTFKAADMAAVGKLFNGNTSYAYQISLKAEMIQANAASEANSKKNYTNSGTYENSYSVGNLLDSIF